ncbi:MAG TPA: ATP-binding protein [Amycolatopsis sp.]
MPKFLRSTRFRVAVTAFAASAVALGAVSVWFIAQTRDRLDDAAAQLARTRGDAIVQLLDNGASPGDLPRFVRDTVYEVIDRAGTHVTACPGLSTLARGTPVNTDQHVGVFTDGRVGCAPRLEGLDLHITHVLSGDGTVDVYVAAWVDPVGRARADTARAVLSAGVPLVAVLIGVIAWLAVRRSLRPVEAIRAEVAEIGAHDLARRVPDPRSGDEIARLAGTMNTMLARLDDAVARQSRFTSDASHELRSPLASMQTQLEVLLAHPGRFDWREVCENTLLDVARLQALVADLVLLGKLDHAPPERLDAVPLTETVDAGLSGREAREGVSIHAELDAAAVVRGHRTRLERLVRNLLDNAERHARSRVDVTVSVVDGQAVLTVADDGPGIPAEDRERVFNRFVRLDDGLARDESGAGLGLAIVADIARAHGGVAEVADHEDGARFVVRFPNLKPS